MGIDKKLLKGTTSPSRNNSRRGGKTSYLKMRYQGINDIRLEVSPTRMMLKKDIETIDRRPPIRAKQMSPSLNIDDELAVAMNPDLAQENIYRYSNTALTSLKQSQTVFKESNVASKNNFTTVGGLFDQNVITKDNLYQTLSNDPNDFFFKK